MPRPLKLRLSKKQEETTARIYRGSRTPQSGAGWAYKNDVRTEHFLIENKMTSNKRSITIKADDLEQLRANAIMSSRMGVLQFDLNGSRYVILNEDDFLEGING